MLYRKNVPVWERILRVFLALGLVAFALLAAPLQGASSMLMMSILIGSAALIAVTGFVGWCPACAMVGRKLKNGGVRGQ